MNSSKRRSGRFLTRTKKRGRSADSGRRERVSGPACFVSKYSRLDSEYPTTSVRRPRSRPSSDTSQSRILAGCQATTRDSRDENESTRLACTIIGPCQPSSLSAGGGTDGWNLIDTRLEEMERHARAVGATPESCRLGLSRGKSSVSLHDHSSSTWWGHIDPRVSGASSLGTTDSR